MLAPQIVKPQFEPELALGLTVPTSLLGRGDEVIE